MRIGLSVVAIVSAALGATPAYAALQNVRVGHVEPTAMNPDPNLALSVTVRCDKQGLRIGDEVPIDLVLTNTGTADYAFIAPPGENPTDTFDVVALDARGNAVPNPRTVDADLTIRQGYLTWITLKPGESFSKRAALNEWALLKKPGTYRVTAAYRLPSYANRYESKPIIIELAPRTDAEMAAYIERLSAQLDAAPDEATRLDLVRKSMHTCDARTAPMLLEALYGKGLTQFAAREAFLYYLPDSVETTALLTDAAAKRGLAGGMALILQRRGVGSDRIKDLIAVSLAPDHPEAWGPGALAAQWLSDDRFVPRLVAIAFDPDSGARAQAIHALALNRTEESVATLRKLLENPDESIRKLAADAMDTAHRSQGDGQGQPVRTENFAAHDEADPKQEPAAE